MAGLLLALTMVTALGCASVGAGHYRLEHDVAGASVDGTQITIHSDGLSAQMGCEGQDCDGVVDLSGSPTIVDAPDDEGRLADHRFSPGPMLAVSEVASWVGEDFDGSSLALELANACSVSLDYAFGPSDDPSEADHARRVLDGHTLQTQEIPRGHWLHLWDGDRWLGAAVTTVDGGQLEISTDCDTLEISVEMEERGLTTFAIHWELDAEEPNRAGVRAIPALDTLDIDSQDHPEQWGVDADGPRVELRFANACAEPVDYAFEAELDGEPEATGTATIAANSERQVEIPAGWWLRYRVLDDAWRGSAATSHGGGVVWIESNCVDFGVADGEIVGIGGLINK